MQIYTPDSWKLVKFTSPEYGTIYKVLASWAGGFANGDSWKLSSGIEGVTVRGSVITMPQYSGSVYKLYLNDEHVSMMIGSVFASFEKAVSKQEQCSIQMVTLNEVINFFKKGNEQ